MGWAGGESGESGMAMGRLRFSVTEVGRGGRERTVDVKPWDEKDDGLLPVESLWSDRG